MKAMLFDKYWLYFWIWLIISVVIIIVLSILIAYRNKLLLDKTNMSNTKLIRVIMFSAVSIFMLYSLTKFTLLCLDLSYVNSNNCDVFEGEFIRYTKFVESNDPSNPRGSYPLFINIDNGEKIILGGTQHYQVGETYTIYYLPNSMVYIVEITN